MQRSAVTHEPSRRPSPPCHRPGRRGSRLWRHDDGGRGRDGLSASAEPYADPNPHANPYANPHPDAHANTGPEANTDPDANTTAHADTRPDADTAPNTGPDPASGSSSSYTACPLINVRSTGGGSLSLQIAHGSEADCIRAPVGSS